MQAPNSDVWGTGPRVKRCYFVGIAGLRNGKGGSSGIGGWHGGSPHDMYTRNGKVARLVSTFCYDQVWQLGWNMRTVLM